MRRGWAGPHQRLLLPRWSYAAALRAKKELVVLNYGKPSPFTGDEVTHAED